MATHSFKTVRDWERAMARDLRIQAFNISTGYAAALLSISRQRVHQLIESEALDCVRTGEGVILLSQAEVEEYRDRVTSKPIGRRVLAGRQWLREKRRREAQISLDL